MSRFELGGKGEPIPLVALPDPNLDDNLPPKMLVLQDGVPFVKTDWVGLGYTHYEVWCVGAAGGKGGDGGGRYGIYAATSAALDPAIIPPTVSWPYYVSGGITHWHDPYVDKFNGANMYIPFPSAWGGGGGGGGLHVVAGLLIDLPDECPVVVGQAGTNADPGQISHPNPITPIPPYSPGSINDTPGVTLVAPVTGEDGGHSSFNGDTCKASGGKGGNPGAHWSGSTLMYEAKGGDGGVGNQTAAGGGAAGSATEDNGADGTWDGAIGEGGGGGRGGMITPREPDSMGGV